MAFSSALWLDVLLQLTRGWSHKSRKGQLSELQSWARHISYSLGDLLRALHQICLSSCLTRTPSLVPPVSSLSVFAFLSLLVLFYILFLSHLSSLFPHLWCFLTLFLFLSFLSPHTSFIHPIFRSFKSSLCPYLYFFLQILCLSPSLFLSLLTLCPELDTETSLLALSAKAQLAGLIDQWSSWIPLKVNY